MVTTINVERALAIEGWMSEAELVWLAEQAVEHRCIVEIGSYLGRSTRAMLDHTPGIVYAIDDWKGPRDVYISKEERDGLYQRFLNNLTDKFDKVVVFQMDHGRIGDFPQPDMVFIDGSHEYEDVKRDIRFWKDKLVPGGLLCGHDAGVFDGVTRAVMELLADAEVAEDTTIWWTKV